MSDQAQILLINNLPVIIAAFFAGVLTIIMQLRHIKHLTNSALTIQTKRAEDAEAATKAGEILAKKLVDEELIRLKARESGVPLAAPAVLIDSAAPVKVDVVSSPDDPVIVEPVEKDKK